MKNFFLCHLLIFLLYYGVFSQTCIAQERQSWMNPMGSLRDVNNGAFSSIEAGFSINLPDEIGGSNPTTGVSYSWRLNEGFFIVGTVERIQEIEGTSMFRSETYNIIQDVFIEFQRDLFKSPIKPSNVDGKEITFDGHQGYEMRVEMPKALCIIRVVWVKQKAYKIGLLLFENQYKFEPEALKVFDTLKIMSPEEIDTIVRHKVEKATPLPLPQTPVAKKLKSDAEDEKLKGKVKTVFQESKYIKGLKAGTPAQKDIESYFNAIGNYTKRIFYSDTSGLPFEIEVYGYIDGKRVLISNSITYGFELQVLSEQTTTSPKKPDPRYSLRLDYKYGNDGKLREQSVFTNDGIIWTRTVYIYKENIVEETTYQDYGKLNTKSITTIDPKGNPIESIYFGTSNKDWEEKSVYSYNEFDKQGNWTKRTTTFFRQIKGVVREEWITETYRKISYY